LIYLEDLKVNLDDVIKLKEEQERDRSNLVEDDEYNLDEYEGQTDDNVTKDIVTCKDVQDDDDNSAEKASGKMALNTKRPKKEEYKIVR
jgi:hypothetical protein